MYISWENSIHPTIIHLFFIIILLGFLRGVWDERMKHFIKYLLYVNIQVTGVFNTLYSVAYLFQYITRDVIVYCFDAILFLCLFIITYYYFCIWLICFLFLFCLFVCHPLIPHPPKKTQQNNDKKQINNSWMYRIFSRNIHLQTTNTIYLILQPP
jgi:hypothetical protein